MSAALPNTTSPLPGSGGGGGETPRGNHNPKRRQQLLNLLDALTELNKDPGAFGDSGRRIYSFHPLDTG
jgi:hypothetical protein